MQVIFYKASYGNVVDKIIAWWTSSIREKLNGSWRLSYSHVELLFSDGIMFSASQYENKTRYKRYNTHSKAWEAVEVTASTAEEAMVRTYCTQRCSKPYDYKGILGFVIGTPDAKGNYFCSEICTEALQLIEVASTLEPSKTSPNRLYKELIKDFNEDK